MIAQFLGLVNIMFFMNGCKQSDNTEELPITNKKK